MTAAGALDPVRRRYAETMTAALPGVSPDLVAAFATVRREDFLAPPPWTLLRSGAPARIAHDPAALYADVLVPLDPARGLNNGSPALHARMLHLLAPQPGEHALHVGAGGGYYSAILAELVGASGAVLAVEFEARLAAEAARRLAPWPWVTVAQGDGAAAPPASVQRIYVNCAVADIPDRWLDALDPCGRLLLPLGVPDPQARGEAARHTAEAAVLAITRAPDGFEAAFDVPVSFVCADGPLAGDALLRRDLYEAFRRGGLDRVRRLRREAVDGAWLATPRWSLCDA